MYPFGELLEAKSAKQGRNYARLELILILLLRFESVRGEAAQQDLRRPFVFHPALFGHQELSIANERRGTYTLGQIRTGIAPPATAILNNMFEIALGKGAFAITGKGRAPALARNLRLNGPKARD